MKRMKRHKVKTEVPETSTSYSREQEVHDLAYYIHDRVELMHQVFSLLKYKELKAMAPACIRNISIDDLQELCTEELLGISSKRLCAILDGAEPPSDTESSSPSPPPEQLETISLDSISSDEEILSQSSGNKKKKHKHRHRDSKSKSKHRKSKEQDDGEADKSKASRAGLTVLELLELQARARAIRAQLQNEQQNKPSASESMAAEPPHSSDNEVEIKEEPPEVVEISSEDEKPKLEELDKQISQQKTPDPPQQSTTVTKRINDLVITVPQKSTQKIKLNRNKSFPAPPVEKTDSVASIPSTENVVSTKIVEKEDGKDKSSEDRDRDKNRKDKSRKKKKHKKRLSKDDVDNDEITLQLSDTEKMDLLEDLDRKNYDSVSSDTSSSDSSSDSDVSRKDSDKIKDSILKEKEITPENMKDCQERVDEVTLDPEKVKQNNPIDSSENNKNVDSPEQETSVSKTEDSNKELRSNLIENKKNNTEEKMDTENTEIFEINLETERDIELVQETNICNENHLNMTTQEDHASSKDDQKDTEEDNKSKGKDNEKNLSEGELSDRESSEVEAVDLKPEVVCISDEEGGDKSKKKKKKKEKKQKKEKKPKKKSDFRDSCDQNFYKDDGMEKTTEHFVKTDSKSINELPVNKNIDTTPLTECTDKVDITVIDIDKTERESFNNDKLETFSNVEHNKEVKSTTNTASSNSYSDDDIEEIFEILELSDDSSCCEVECTILSKEPTAHEIEALSAKIDEIDRVEVITDEEIRQYESVEEDRIENIENISWKDRYLDSKKVKKVLTTANVLNALRKKNRELKKKLAESKKDTAEEKEPEKKIDETKTLEEGTIEHYNTLEGSTKYVNPLPVPGDLKKDAKLLLKMYKKLLKYNDINKQKDPNKKKKKKSKKKNKKDVGNKELNVVENKEEYNLENSKVSLERNKEVSVESKEENIINKEDG